MKNLKLILVAVLIYAIVVVIFTYPTIVKMDTSVYGPVYGTDYRGAIRHIWWVGYAFKNQLDWRKDIMINYPFGEEYDWPIFAPLWQLCAYPLTIIFNEVVAINCVFMLSFILSGLTMFLLCFYLTNDYRCSWLAGLMYSFCPYHFNKIWEHLGPALIEWLPLYALCLLRIREDGKFKNVLFCAIAFTAVVFTDFYFAYFMAIFTLGFILFIMIYNWRSKIYSIYRRKWIEFRQFVKSDSLICFKVLICSLITLILTLPATLKIFKVLLSTGDNRTAIAQGLVRDFHYLFTQAALPLNYLLPASVHPIFGKFTRSMFGSIFYGRGPIEQTLYLGVVPLILAFVAYKNWKRQRIQQKSIFKENRVNFIIGFFIFVAFFSFIFSLPPYFNLGIFKIYFPASFMYKIFPMFRAYARFGILVMLSVSVLAAFGLKYVFQRVASQRKITILAVVFSCLVLFEFTNFPPLRATDVSDVPGVYQWLSLQKEDFVIAEYPIGQAGKGGGESHIELDYLFYQRIHQKRIINGAKPGTDAYLIKQKLLKITDPGIPETLRSLGVKYVILHLRRYEEGTNKRAVDVIGDVPDLTQAQGLRLVKKFGKDEVYEVTAKADNYYLK